MKVQLAEDDGPFGELLCSSPGSPFAEYIHTCSVLKGFKNSIKNSMRVHSNKHLGFHFITK